MSADKIQAIAEKCSEYREYKRMIQELEALADSIADELKAELREQEVDTLVCGEYKISHKEASRKDIDKKRLEAEHKALYEAYLKEVSYRRFLVS